MVLPANSFLENLPFKIVNKIFDLLDGRDVISLSNTCYRLTLFCRKNLSQVNFRNEFTVSSVALGRFIQSSINPEIITIVDFSNCYWLADSLLTSFIVECVNLKVLQVAGTQITSSSLAVIFKYCHKVTQLSFTIHTNDLWKDSLHFPWKTFSFVPLPVELFDHCVLQEVRQSIQKIKVLEISFSRPGELITFLSACKDLEDLTVIWINDPSGYPCSPGPILSANKNVVGNFQLKSLIFQAIGFKNLEFLKYVNCATVDFSRMELFWNEFVPCPKTKSANSWIGLASKDIENWNRHCLMENWRREYGTRAALPLRITALPLRIALPWQPYIASVDVTQSLCKLKVLECIYSEQNFLQFCRRHPNLSQLKLRSPPTKESDPEIKDRLVPFSKSFTHLKSFSVEPIYLSENSQQSAKRPRLTFSLLHSNLSSLVEYCPFLEELEISLFPSYEQLLSGNSLDRAFLIAEDLSLIGKCVALKKLTLGYFDIENGTFLEAILQGCQNLNSLRLENLGSEDDDCCYTDNLCASLHCAKKLVTFRMKQENCIKFGMLLESFLSCSSLVQLSLIISPAPLHSLLVESEKLNFPNAAFQVAALLKRLIALFFCVPIPTDVCCKVEKNLLLMIQPTRPAFCVNIKSSFDDKYYFISSLPVVHRKSIVEYCSLVGQLPYQRSISADL